MNNRILRLANARSAQDDSSSQQQYLLLQTSLAFQLLFFFIFLSTTGMLSADSSELTALSTRSNASGTKQPIRNGSSQRIALDLQASALFITGSDQIQAKQLQRLDSFFQSAANENGTIWVRYRFAPETGSLYQQNSIWNDALQRLATLQRYATDRGIIADRIDAGVEPLLSASIDVNSIQHSVVQLALRPTTESSIAGGI